MASYVYRRPEEALFTVGYYDPEGRWQPESDHPTAHAAAFRVHWLNGGTPVPQAVEVEQGIRNMLWELAKRAVSAEPSREGMVWVIAGILELLQVTEKGSV